MDIGRSTGGRGFDTFSYPELLAMREEASPLAAVAGWTWMPLSLSTGGPGERITGMVASHDYFDVMGVRPHIGRFIAPDEDAEPGSSAVAVLSHRFWMERFGGNPAVLGMDVDINRVAFTVIGVAPASWRGQVFGLDPDVYVPLTMMGVANPGFNQFGQLRSSWLMGVGRLAPGASVERSGRRALRLPGTLDLDFSPDPGGRCGHGRRPADGHRIRARSCAPVHATRPGGRAEERVPRPRTGRAGPPPLRRRPGRVFGRAARNLGTVPAVAAAGSSIDAGFDPSNVEIVGFDLSLDGYDRERGLAFIDDVLSRMRGQPGVRNAALAADLPLDLTSHGSPAWPEGWNAEAGAYGLGADFNVVSDGYFEALGIDIVQGRSFEDTDRAGSMPVAIVSRTFALRAWPGRNAVGLRVRADTDGDWLTVVGVAADVKNQLLSEDTGPMIYYPLRQRYSAALTLAVKGEPAAGRMSEAMQETILAVDPALSLDMPADLEAWTAVGILPQRIGAAITTVSDSLRCFFPRSACMASSRSWCRSGRARSACGWRWARVAAK